MGIYVYPFDPDKVRYGGASSAEEFKGWISKYGHEFYYTQRNTKTGDILVFAWRNGKNDWVMVGDTIVKDNHKIDSQDWCSCRSEKASSYTRHIVTGGIRLYPKGVETKNEKFEHSHGPFISISPEEYAQVISNSVSHWNP